MTPRVATSRSSALHLAIAIVFVPATATPAVTSTVTTATRTIEQRELDPAAGLALDEAGDLPAASDAPWVFGASQRRQSLEEAPSAVTIVTAEEIRRYGYRKITDLLASVRGMYVSDDLDYSYVGLRGFGRLGEYNTRILVLVDGHSMGEPIFASSLLGRELGIDLDLVERVEIIRGPGSALYGTNAVLGVINIVTRSAPDVRHLDGLGVRAALSGDTEGRARGEASFERFISPKVRVAAGASAEYSVGRELEFPELASSGLVGPTARTSDRGRWLNAFAELAAGPFSLRANVNSVAKRVPTASFGVIPEAGEETFDTRGFVEGKLILTPLPDLELSTRLYLDRSHYAGDYPFAEDAGGLFQDGSDALWLGGEVIASDQLTPWLHLLGGVNAQRSFIAETIAEQRAIGVRQAIDHDFSILGLFAEATANIEHLVTLIAGARLDAYDTFGAELSPRAGAIFSLVPGTTLKLLYGEAFRAPTIYELYYDSPTNEPNPSLAPEVVRHYEAVLEQELGGRGGLLTLVLYHFDADGLISPTEVPGTGRERYENLDAVHATGAELEVRGSLPWLGLRGGLAYTFSHVADRATGARIANSPEHVATGRLLAPLWAGGHLGAEVHLLGERPGLPGRPSAPRAITADLTLTWDDVAPGLDLALGVKNVLDERWVVPGGVEHRQDGVPQEGRHVFAKIAYLF